MGGQGKAAAGLLAAVYLAAMHTAECAALAAGGVGVGGAVAGAPHGRRLLQGPRPALPSQENWWSAVLENNDSPDGQQSWWMDIITRTAQAVQAASQQAAGQQPMSPPPPPPAAGQSPPAGDTPPPAPNSTQLTANEKGSGLSPDVVWPPTTFASSQERRNFEEATVNSTDVAPCVSAGDGGQMCGIPIGYEGVANRTGYYYLPKTYSSGPLPLLVLLHGAGVNGSWMLTDLPFMEMADKHQVIVVTPDSIDDMDWLNPKTKDDGFTRDWWHIEACYHWFATQNPQGAQIDTGKVSIAGNSRAGYTGPPFCSRSVLVPCSAAVIMHASAEADEMGPKVIPILWTGGERDPLYTEERNAEQIAEFRAAAPQFQITYQIWESSHSLNKAQEIDYIVKWCADAGFRGTPAPPLGSYRRRLAASPAERRQR